MNLAPLRVPAFRRLVVSYTVNELGDSVGVVALALLVYDQTRSPLATTALFIFASFLPAFLSPLVTAHLDHRSLRRVLARVYIVEAVVFVVLSIVASRFLLGVVLAFALLDGTLALAARGLTRGAIASVLEPSGTLSDGNALVNVGFALASVLGAALGGLLVATVGVPAALLVDAASFALIAGLMATASGLPRAHTDESSFSERVRQGLSHAWQHRPARVLLVGQAVAMVLFTLIVPIEVVYAKQTLGAGDAGYGLLLSAWGLGIVLGSLIYVRVNRRSSARLILVSTAAIGLAYCGMAAAGTLAVACICSVVGGAGNGVQWVSVVTALQERTPSGLQARVVGLLESIGSAMPGVGFVLGGLLTEVGSPRTAFAVAGGGLLVLLVVGWVPARRIAVGPRALPSG